MATFLATGESTAVALVALALSAGEVPFAVLDVGRVGPFTRGPLLDAEPVALDTDSIGRALAKRRVGILPGFVGRDEGGDVSLLGRGGSDLTALFVARSLGASRCLLLKDVGGVYEFDPRGSSSRPRRFHSLNWRDALELGDHVMQRKALQYAYRHRVPFEVGRCGAATSTIVGAESTVLASPRRRDPAAGFGAARPMARVAARRQPERRAASCR